MNPYKVVKDFEQALCDYTGAKYAVTTTSCTMALLLACRWHAVTQLIPNQTITIPKRTYVGVPMSIIHAGFDVAFAETNWIGDYRLNPLPVWDSARFFSSEMIASYKNPNDQFVCVSFHWSKTLAIGQGGAILHGNDAVDAWLREMRFDGRIDGISAADQGEEQYRVIGYHCYMSPRDAAEGLSRLAVLPKHNDPLPNDDYPDLSRIEIFK
jgi:dTDP-4-amino-4,6-dideoxygalactose transaminase